MKHCNPRLGGWAILACLPLFVACGDQNVPVAPQRAVPERAPEPARVAYLEGTHTSEAIKQVRDKVGEPFRVLEIMVFSDRVKVQVQDPKKPEVSVYRPR